MDRETLLALCKEDLVAIILAQFEQINTLLKRVADLETRLNLPPKTPDNSSTPPSQAQKANRPDRPHKPRRGRPGMARALADHPDPIIEATLDACPHCACALGPADQPRVHAYDHIDLPPIRPVVTRIHRHRGACPSCRKPVAAPAPDGLASGSPFGSGLRALILYLHVTQAIGFERLARLLAEVFGLTISQGAIANILARAEAPLVTATGPIADTVRRSPVVGSDETSARVAGRTCWQWVLLSSTAICHIIAETRAASVVTAFLGGARPDVWVADRYGGQLGHGAARQMCLAHLLRDAQYAIDEGCQVFAPRFRLLLLRAGPLPDKAASRRLMRAMRRHRDDLLRFVRRRDVPPTNNACERALRPSVIFRKVTGGFRAKWGATVYAAAATVIATGRLHGLTALEALRAALAGWPVMKAA